MFAEKTWKCTDYWPQKCYSVKALVAKNNSIDLEIIHGCWCIATLSISKLGGLNILSMCWSWTCQILRQKSFPELLSSPKKKYFVFLLWLSYAEYSSFRNTHQIRRPMCNRWINILLDGSGDSYAPHWQSAGHLKLKKAPWILECWCLPLYLVAESRCLPSLEKQRPWRRSSHPVHKIIIKL